jgi:hypothetical protein
MSIHFITGKLYVNVLLITTISNYIIILYKSLFEVLLNSHQCWAYIYSKIIASDITHPFQEYSDMFQDILSLINKL